MVSERYERLLNELLAQTECFHIKWRPIQEYINTRVYPKCENSALAEHIQVLYCVEGFKLYLDKSFFVQKDGYIIALLNYKAESAKDGSISENLDLVGEIYGLPMKRFPEYIEGGFIVIQNAILKYWEHKKNDYSIETSDSFELLRTFTEED